jgi:antitoxin (DNA-binding transcriptional repressor) of toxin-antitoxin stability system
LRKGERYVITYRGKPVALMLPFPAENTEELVPRAYGEARQDIELTLQESEAEYASWEVAISAGRRRR